MASNFSNIAKVPKAVELSLNKAIHNTFFFLLALYILSSCKPHKDLAEGQYLLHQQTIHLDSATKEEEKAFFKKVDYYDLENILKQKPNKRLLRLYKLHLQLYTYGSRKDNGFRRWLKKLGEPPAILDTSKLRKSTEQLALFLKKKGYFMAQAYDTLTYGKKQRVSVDYFLVPRDPYTVKKVSYFIEDTALIDDISHTTRKTLVDPGANYDEYVLSDERSRIERAMKNRGYYNFTKQYVNFLVDSNRLGNKVNIETQIKSASVSSLTEEGNDTLITEPHKKYFIKDIYVTVEDRTGHGMNLGDTLLVNGYHFLNHGHKLIRPFVILRALFFKPGDQYSLQNIEYSYERLGNLRAFKSININVYPDPKDPKGDQLIVVVDLSPNARHSFMVDTEGTNRAGNLGVNGSVGLTNRNAFHGAEVLEFKVMGGLEAQRIDNTILEEDDPQDRGVLGDSPFNTLEYGFSSTLKIPGLWIPRKTSKIPSYTKPTTQFEVLYNHQLRSAYKRDIFNISFSYNWFMNRKHGFKVSPVDLSFVSIDKAQWFDDRLTESGNSLLINSYQNHLIPATIFQYEFTNQERYDRNYMFFRTSLESAGNTLRLLDNALGSEQFTDSSGTYFKKFDIRYAQYVKVDGDIRLYNVITQETRSVYRFYGGIGVPLENLGVLPFEKSFFGGGTNNNRAWVLRTMGPGGMPDTVINVDKIGDLKFELNWEFRFKVIGSLESAFFVDAGNIWIREVDDKRPLADFQLDRFYKELAIGSGIGARLDLSFFIIRFDLGYRVHDPIYPEGERWFWQSKDQYRAIREQAQRNLSDGQSLPNEAFRGVNFNLGIGYPF